jgi:hypothetical protein
MSMRPNYGAWTFQALRYQARDEGVEYWRDLNRDQLIRCLIACWQEAA